MQSTSTSHLPRSLPLPSEDDEDGPRTRRQRLDDVGHPSTPTALRTDAYSDDGMNIGEEMSFSQSDNPAPSGAAADAHGLKQKKSIHDRVHGQVTGYRARVGVDVDARRELRVPHQPQDRALEAEARAVGERRAAVVAHRQRAEEAAARVREERGPLLRRRELVGDDVERVAHLVLSLVDDEQVQRALALVVARAVRLAQQMRPRVVHVHALYCR